MVPDPEASTVLMTRKSIPLSVLAAALSACVVEPELLNSERIAERFGSYGVFVISFENGIRRSMLYSENGGFRVCRTYAVVRFENVPDSIAGDEHARILAGSSIGEVFKADGWNIYKETRYVGELALPGGDSHLRDLMHLDGAAALAMHIYRLHLKKNDQTIEYATIIEIHHPEYLTRQQLEKLYLIDAPKRPSEQELSEFTDLVLTGEAA